ncbi:fungal-specific transcription factor domain-containing protein [Aspergillus carlsbadensis]|nr:fungal-specific transcription factor domain-containing protein [Aspergillus carlsbadensis]
MSMLSLLIFKCVYRPIEPLRRRRVGSKPSRTSIAKGSRTRPGRQRRRASRSCEAAAPNESPHSSNITLSGPALPRIEQTANRVEQSSGADARTHRDLEDSNYPVQEDVSSDISTPRLVGINTYTSGTEFYGGSSNLAFLTRLFTKARPASDGLARIQDVDGESRHLNSGQCSLVDLMYSADYALSSNGEDDSLNGTSVSAGNTPILRQDNDHNSFPVGPTANLRNTSTPPPVPLKQPRELAEERLERYFIEVYFTNVHYIHPLLDERTFRSDCDKTVWSNQPRPHLDGQESKFLALYYAVVALGVINSADQSSSSPIYYQSLTLAKADGASTKCKSTLELASLYFGLARQALGNTMETSSLETCQALFLMTVFCQNALKPHACYMYSGIAIRTALAIGLAHNHPLHQTPEIERTWWCMYSHEIEMCCSSGRLDSLMFPEYYPLPMPQISEDDPGHESHAIAIIPVMVALARILKQASMEIYCKGVGQCRSAKSQLSLHLNRELDQWKANLPRFLNFDIMALDDPEWAYKQKIVLKIRFYNTRIVINRPFLDASDFTDISEFSEQVDLCLDAARQTIYLIHNAFANRTYLRTWWYCTTYTLYASMILLYLVLMRFPRVPSEDLLADVERSLEIFRAMKQVVVSRRCEEISKEILSVIRKRMQDAGQGGIVNGVMREQPSSVLDRPVDMTENQQVRDTSNLWADSSLAALFSQALPNCETGSALSNIYDPHLLGDFALSEVQPFTLLDAMPGIPRGLFDVP